MRLYTGKKWKIDFLPRLSSFWIGAHYSDQYKALCVAIIPCLVIRFGETDYVKDEDTWADKIKRYFFIFPIMIFRPGSCWHCGSDKLKDGYKDYLDGHTLLEAETKCARCDSTVVCWAYGGYDDPFYYLNTRWERFRYLYFNILEDKNGKRIS